MHKKNNKRCGFGSIGVLSFLVLFGSGPARAQTPAPADNCGAEYEKLKKEHETLVADYNNVLAQAKALMQYKTKVRDIEDLSRQAVAEKDQLTKEKEDALAKVAELEAKVQQLDGAITKTNLEREDYKNSFEKASVRNIMGDDTKKKISGLESNNVAYEKDVQVLKTRIRTLEIDAAKSESELDLYKRQISDMKEKYEEALQKNRTLGKKIEDTPKKFTELARENKVLIKRTALMHYNLGVFYTQNKEFERAVAELEKAVELNPEDSASYFNLGYIYSEHLLNRPKAVEHFKKFLKIAKRDDRDTDWVKRYVLTWQTWEGNKPIK
jgi:tetratricopeptide (TPR) repeat protein